MAKTILMAEDSKSVRALMSRVLQEAGYEVVEASDGVEALHKANCHVCDMLITDLNMPGLDGIGLIREVRKSAGNRFLPIVVLTSEDTDESRQRGRNAGASSWVVKPFKPEQLLNMVRTVLP